MKKKNKDLAIDTGASVVGAGIGFALGNLPGALVGGVVTPVLAEVLSRSLSKKETTRIEKVASLATKKIKAEIERGVKIRDAFDKSKAEALFEGTLLKAKNAYEEKKIPLIANLFARSLFTNTPIENSFQCLALADQLSYRHLCILSIVGDLWWKGLGSLVENDLSKIRFSDEKNKQVDEFAEGTYNDVFYLMSLELIIQFTDDGEHIRKVEHSGQIVPALLTPMYMGRIMFNAMSLNEIPQDDIDQVKAILK